jgi:hypothetical protein
MEKLIDVKFEAVKTEIKNGFDDLKARTDKIELDKGEQWKKINDNSEKAATTKVKISGLNKIMSVLIMLQITTLGLLIRLVWMK